MLYSKFNLKLVVIATSLLVIGVALSAIYFSLPKKTPRSTSSVNTVTTTADDYDAKRVFIKGLNKYQDSLSPDDQLNIEKIMYTYASLNGTDLYIGLIRPGSYSNTTVNNTNTIHMLVDVQPVNLTYQIDISEYKHNGFRPIYITCAPKTQQIDQSATCKGGKE